MGRYPLEGSGITAALKLAAPVVVDHYDVKESSGRRAAEMVADLRFRQKVAKLHALGARATCELLAQIVVQAGAHDVVDEALDDFCRAGRQNTASRGRGPPAAPADP